MSIGASTRLAKDIVQDYRVRDLIDPDYQREYVWSPKKAFHFLRRTISLEHVLGVITTYKLKGGSTKFLQDGRQRITTLMRAIENPSLYGLTKEDVLILQNANVSHQSMEYESHDDARLDFQHLNDGIGLVPYEKYRGDLERDIAGKEMYELIRVKLDDLSVGMAGISRSSDHGRKKAGQLHRNSLGLFYQYASRHKEIQLYAKSERSLNDQIERRVRIWLDQNLSDWRSKADAFIQTIERVNAILRTKTDSHPAKRWDLTAVRALYSAHFYSKNNGLSSDFFMSLVEWFVASNTLRKTWAARFEVVVHGQPVVVRMDQMSLRWLERVKDAGGPAFVIPKRERRYIAQAGFEDSHIIPHADGGTETIVEPAITNRARGRRPIEGMSEASNG